MNYGNHLGNDAVLSVIHEARMQFLAKMGYFELDIGGCGLIMADVMIAYKNEGYYGDVLSVEIFVDEVSSRSFDLMYKMTVWDSEHKRDIAHAKTGMVCFDYTSKKIVQMPDRFRQLLESI